MTAQEVVMIAWSRVLRRPSAYRPAHAALDIGERAPDFTAPAAQGGKVYQFSLADSLKKGPVVLYFFPAAYSEGCSIEAHEFAEAIPQFEALGATVVGVSGDDIDDAVQVLGPVLPEQIPGRFRRDAGGDEVVRRRDADAARVREPHLLRDRARTARSLIHYMSLNPTKHVEKMLGAVRGMPAGQNK